ncbi:MAG TPA: acyltransferase [Candidatus Didemnitutus sp.]|jgi:peptidoglycan/LPS O-acetylase OafA/YrhL
MISPGLPKRLEGLTILRFFAAFWVVLFHLRGRSSFPAGQSFLPLIDNGPMAMALFFILSGVVLAYGYSDLSADGVPAFYFARFSRIYPAYFCVHFCALFFFPVAEAGGWIQWIYVNILGFLCLQSWIPHAFRYSVNGGTWTIGNEFTFYALFPFLLRPLELLRRRWGILGACVPFVLLSGYFGAADYMFAGQGTFIYYISPFARLPEFIIGMILGLDLLEPPRRRGLPRLAVVGSVLALLAVAELVPTYDFGQLWTRWNIVIVPAAAATLYAVARAEQIVQPAWTFVTSRILIYLGGLSYCLFLGHMLPVVILDLPAGRAWRNKIVNAGNGFSLWVVLLFASFAIALALHEGVEKPMRRWLQRRWSPPAIKMRS